MKESKPITIEKVDVTPEMTQELQSVNDYYIKYNDKYISLNMIWLKL